MTSITNNLIIRADASTRMGTGHVMRCIALGQAWQDAGGNVSFVSCCDSDGIKKRIREEGFTLVELPDAYPRSEEDLSTTLELATQSGATWVVVDGYHFDLAYQQAVRQAGLKLLYVDDYNHLQEYDADILLNQNIGAEEFEYCCNPECRSLLGLRYVMLRREFRSLGSKEECEGAVKHVLVTMGGSDPDNATLQVIKAFLRLDVESLLIRVVVGTSNLHLESLRNAIKGQSMQIELLTAVNDMSTLMQWADFAISAAGSTCWELASVGIPFATVILAENQQGIANGLETCCQLKCLGWPTAGFQQRVEHLMRDIMECRVQLREQCCCLVAMMDSLGVERILSETMGRYEG